MFLSKAVEVHATLQTFDRASTHEPEVSTTGGGATDATMELAFGQNLRKSIQNIPTDDPSLPWTYSGTSE